MQTDCSGCIMEPEHAAGSSLAQQQQWLNGQIPSAYVLAHRGRGRRKPERRQESERIAEPLVPAGYGSCLIDAR